MISKFLFNISVFNQRVQLFYGICGLFTWVLQLKLKTYLNGENTPKSLATGLVGCAPQPIQYLILSELKLTSFSL